MSTKISSTWKGHLWVFSSDYSTEMPPSDCILLALKNTHSLAWRMRFAYVSGHLKIHYSAKYLFIIIPALSNVEDKYSNALQENKQKKMCKMFIQAFCSSCMHISS